MHMNWFLNTLFPGLKAKEEKNNEQFKTLAGVDSGSGSRVRGNSVDEDIYASASDLSTLKHKEERQGIEKDSCDQIQHAYLDIGHMFSSNKNLLNTRTTGVGECLESSCNGEDFLSIKSKDTDEDNKTNNKFHQTHLVSGDFHSDDTHPNDRRVAVNNNFPSSDVTSNNRETIGHLYFTSDDQLDSGNLFRHTESDDGMDDFTDELKIRKKNVHFKSGHEDLNRKPDYQDQNMEEDSLPDPPNVGMESEYLVPDAYIQQTRQSNPSLSCTDELFPADISSDICKEHAGNETEDSSVHVSSLDTQNHLQNLVIYADKLDCEYAEIPDSPNFTHTRLDSPLNDEEGYMVPNAEAVLDSNSFGKTTKDSKVVYEEVDNFEPGSPSNINAKPSPTSVSMTPNKDADYDSLSHIQHAYFGFSDLQAENIISPGKKEQDENGDRKDIKHTFTTLDPELKESDRDKSSSFILYSTTEEGNEGNSGSSENDKSRGKCEANEDDFGYLVME